MQDITTSMSDGQDNMGGVAWERAEAWKLIVAANESGDSDALAVAWSRYSDAMANGALSAAGAVLIPLDRKINGIAQLLTDLANNQRQIEHETQSQADYFYKKFGAFLADADARFDGYDGAISAVLEAVRSLGGIETRLERVEAGQAELAGQVSDLGEKHDALADRVAVVEVTPGTYPDLLQGMQHLEQAITEISRRSDRRQLYLLIAIGSIILLFVVLVALQIARSWPA